MIDAILGLDRPRPPRVQALSGLAEAEIWLREAFGGGTKTDSGVTVNEETAMACAAVKAAVELRADVVAQLPLRVYEDLGEGRKRLAREHPVDGLLHRSANGETPSFNWAQTMQLNTDLWGNGYAEIVRWMDSNQVWSLQQRRSEPHRTKPARRDEDGALIYVCSDQYGNREPDVPARDMLHFKRASFDGLFGRSPVRDGRETIGLAQGRQGYASGFFGRDCKPGGVITVPGELSPEGYERTKAAFNATSERHRIQLLERGAVFAATQMNPTEVQLIEAQRLSVEDVARMYRVPLPLLQLYMSGMAYSSVIELNQAFVTYTLMPIGANWQGEINLKLLEPPYYAEFNYKELLKGDPEKRNNSYRVQFQIGGLTINDFLRKENENPIGPEGDRRFIPMNMIPLDRLDDYVDAIIEGKRGNQAGGELARVRAATERALAQTLQRLRERHGKAAVRAAKQPSGFVDWLETYQAKERAFWVDALQAPYEAWQATAPEAVDAVEDWTDRQLAELKEGLLVAAECPASELVNRIETEVERWSER